MPDSGQNDETRAAAQYIRSVDSGRGRPTCTTNLGYTSQLLTPMPAAVYAHAHRHAI